MLYFINHLICVWYIIHRVPEFCFDGNPEEILSIIITFIFHMNTNKRTLCSREDNHKVEKKYISTPWTFGKFTGSIYLPSYYSCPLACNFAISSLKFLTSLNEQRKMTSPHPIRKNNLKETKTKTI